MEEVTTLWTNKWSTAFCRISQNVACTGVHKCSSIFRSSVNPRLHVSGVQNRAKISRINSADENEQHTHLLERVHTNMWRASREFSFYLPAQISKSANYRGSIMALQPGILWGTCRLFGLKNKVPPAQVNFLVSGSDRIARTLPKPSPCVFARRHEECGGCVRVRERVRGRQGQSVRSSGGNRESVFWMHRWRQCGGSDVAGIITGWQSIWNIWDSRELPLCFFKHRALTWCSSHAPLYWCPCPSHWGVPAKRSRSLTGAASRRIWSCGCKRFSI